MHPTESTTKPKINFVNRIVSAGLLSGIFVTALIWLKTPSRLVSPIFGLCLGLIAIVFLRQLRRHAAHPQWISILAALAAVSLVFLFPELFRPVCGGMPHAFAQENCERKCIQYVCEWNEKKFLYRTLTIDSMG